MIYATLRKKMCGIVSIHSSGMPLQNYEGVLEDMSC